MSFKKDLEFSAGLVREFFSKRRIRETVMNLGRNWSGCEGWLQVEFWHFLSVHDNVSEAMREAEYSLDRRKTKQGKAFADIAFRKKKTHTDWWTVIEMKAKRSARTCLSEIMKDWEKVDCVVDSENDIRDFWLFGVFALGKNKPDELREEIWECVREEGGSLKRNQIICEAIGNTGVGWALF